MEVFQQSVRIEKYKTESEHYLMAKINTEK